MRGLLLFGVLVVGGACGGGGGGADAPAALDDAAGVAVDARPVDAVPCPIGLDETVAGVLTATGDDQTLIWFNGAIVEDTPHPWNAPEQYPVELFRSPRRANVLAFEAANLLSVDGLDRGVIADLAWTVGEARHVVVSSGTWKVATRRQSGWEAPAFDDAAWAPAVDLGPYGMAPWNAVLGTLAPTTPARWLWTYVPDGLKDSKPATDTVFFRYTFFLDVAGAPSAVVPACP